MRAAQYGWFAAREDNCLVNRLAEKEGSTIVARAPRRNQGRSELALEGY